MKFLFAVVGNKIIKMNVSVTETNENEHVTIYCYSYTMETLINFQQRVTNKISTLDDRDNKPITELR